MNWPPLPESLLAKHGLTVDKFSLRAEGPKYYGPYLLLVPEVRSMMRWELEDLPLYALDWERCWLDIAGVTLESEVTEESRIRWHTHVTKPFILARMEAGI